MGLARERGGEGGGQRGVRQVEVGRVTCKKPPLWVWEAVWLGGRWGRRGWGWWLAWCCPLFFDKGEVIQSLEDLLIHWFAQTNL